MSLAIEIDRKQIDAMLTKFPMASKAAINTAFKKIIFNLLAKARPKTPIDKGFLRGAGMQTAFEELVGILKNTAPYARFVHDGTKPHMPPADAIAPWASRHGIPTFMVQRAIAKRGTKAQPFFADAIEESNMETNKFLDDALGDLIKHL